ncbi:MAG TPA: class I SAM-dependent methyltransferase [Azospirillum sp.]
MMGTLVSAYRRAQSIAVPERALMRRFIAARIPASGLPPGLCLDVGAGTAPFAGALAEAAPRSRHLAIDLIRDDCTAVSADAAALPFADGAAALVCAFQVLAHLPDPRRALAEAHRVLAPGGCLLVSYPFLCPEGRSRDLWRWTRPGMEAELRAAGFTPLAHETQGGSLTYLTALLAQVPGRLLIAHRRGWRAGRGPVDALSVGLAFLLSLPFHLLGFAALALDRLAGAPAFYIGGMILARKTDGGGANQGGIGDG